MVYSQRRNIIGYYTVNNFIEKETKVKMISEKGCAK